MSKPVFVAEKKIEDFVEKQNRKGKNMSWEGWDVLVFSPAPRAYSSPRGVFKDGRWGFQNRIKVTSKGFWVFKKEMVA